MIVGPRIVYTFIIHVLLLVYRHFVDNTFLYHSYRTENCTHVLAINHLPL